MANWDNLKAAIQDVIKENGNEEITGQVLQNTLLSIVNNLGENATFAGVATPDTTPGTPDGAIFYIATQQGTYQYFNNLVVNKGEVAIFLYKTSWTKISVFVAPSVPNVLQNSGTSSTDVMSQGAVTAIVGIDDVPQFSEQTSYKVGDFVRYTGLIFKFTAAHSAGQWKGTDTTPSNLAEYIKATTGATVEAVQEWGDSETDVMSQKALTDKILGGLIPGFSTTTRYEKGQYVMYNNKFYEFIAAKSAGAWSDSAVQETSIVKFIMTHSLYNTMSGNQSGSAAIEAQRVQTDLYSLTKFPNSPIIYAFPKTLVNGVKLAYIYSINNQATSLPGSDDISYLAGEPVGVHSTETPFLCGVSRNSTGQNGFKANGRTYVFRADNVDFASAKTLGTGRFFSDYEYVFLGPNFEIVGNWKNDGYFAEAKNEGVYKYLVVSSTLPCKDQEWRNLFAFKELFSPGMSKSYLLSPMWDGTTFTILQEILDLFGLDSKYDLKDNATALLYVKDCPIIKRFRYKNSVTGDWRELYFDGKDDADRQKIWCWKQAESNEHKEYYLRREENSDNNTYYFPVEEMMCRGKVHISPAPAGGNSDWFTINLFDKGNNLIATSQGDKNAKTEFDYLEFTNKVVDTRRILKHFNGGYADLYLTEAPTNDFVQPTSSNLVTKYNLINAAVYYKNNRLEPKIQSENKAGAVMYVPCVEGETYIVGDAIRHNGIANDSMRTDNPVIFLDENKSIVSAFTKEDVTYIKGFSTFWNIGNSNIGYNGYIKFTAPAGAKYMYIQVALCLTAYEGDITDYPVIVCKEKDVLAAIKSAEKLIYPGVVTGAEISLTKRNTFKNIWILGDSLAGGYGNLSTFEGGSMPGWLRYFVEAVKPKSVYNSSAGGNTLTDASKTFVDDVVQSPSNSFISLLENTISRYNEQPGVQHGIPTPDYVFICGCSNDMGKSRGTDVTGNFSGVSYINEDDIKSVDINPNSLSYDDLMDNIFIRHNVDNVSYLNEMNEVPIFKIAGAVRYIVLRVGNLFPNCKFVISTNVINAQSFSYSAQENCNKELRWIANRLSIPIVDVARRANTPPLWEYKRQSVEQMTRRFLADGVHFYGGADSNSNGFNTSAAMRIGYLFASEFERICEYDSKQNIETFDFVTYPHDKNVIYNS
jgi:hypothetical protein|nr:MAG TPA: phospholipase A1 [Caudoviricetes sp.]